MLIPYCMVHFQKTAAESLGSLVAGVLLGWMAMRGRSLWGGALLHWAVAVEMDVLSLIQRGDWPPGR
jgi:membrane protease YdiL (CAAX protease family)